MPTGPVEENLKQIFFPSSLKGFANFCWSEITIDLKKKTWITTSTYIRWVKILLFLNQLKFRWDLIMSYVNL